MARMPFTYLIQFKPTGQFYCGSKTAKGCLPEHLLTTYFTSSKIVRNLIKEFGVNSFQVLSVITHSTIEDAKKWERKTLLAFNAARSSMWLNRTNGDVHNNCFERTSEYKQKLSASAKGKKKSPEHIANSANSRRGIKRTEEQKQNISDALKVISKVGKKIIPLNHLK